MWLKKACVLNGGPTNGVTCYHVDPTKGLIPDGKGLREFGYDFVTPPVLMGSKGSSSDIQFSPDSSKLVTTSKGTLIPSSTLAHIDVFSVGKDGLVETEFRDYPSARFSLPFGMAFDPSKPAEVFVTDAGFGAVLYSIDGRTNQLNTIKIVNSTAAAGASCWAVFSEATGLFYNLDAGIPTIGKVSPIDGAVEGTITVDASFQGIFDGAVRGSLLYFLSFTNKIGVVDLVSGKTIQIFDYATPDDRPHWTGMAIYSSKTK